MERFKFLFKEYVNKTATSAERSELQQMLQNSDYDAELKLLIYAHFIEFEPVSQQDRFGKADQVLLAIFSAADQPAPDIKPEKFVSVRLWPRWAAGIAATLLFISGIYLYNYHQVPGSDQGFSAAQDIGPGSNGATLTLANGKKIRLSGSVSGELAKEAGVIITKTAEGKVVYQIQKHTSQENVTNTLSTGKGETYQVQLPDGSVVWLNSASSLSYPASFAGLKDRVVDLQGEAYFEVAKNKQCPFIVKTAVQDVRVLGTHFNINSYADEPVTKTTLLEGSVLINNGTLLKPGDQAVNSGKAISVKKVDTDNAVGWKNDDFVFSGETFDEAMRKIARWYNVEIVYDHAATRNILPGGWISRKSNISVVLKRIESTGELHFKIEGRRITITE